MVTFPCRRIQINKYRRNEGNRKYPLEYHSNNCHQQYILINAEQAGKSLSRNKALTESQSTSLNIFSNYKGKIDKLMA